MTGPGSQKLVSDLRAENARLRGALKQVAKPGYGLQGVEEDYGHDPNAYNYHAMIYWKSQAEQMQIEARRALNSA